MALKIHFMAGRFQVGVIISPRLAGSNKWTRFPDEQSIGTLKKLVLDVLRTHIPWPFQIMYLLRMPYK